MYLNITASGLIVVSALLLVGCRTTLENQKSSFADAQTNNPQKRGEALTDDIGSHMEKESNNSDLDNTQGVADKKDNESSSHSDNGKESRQGFKKYPESNDKLTRIPEYYNHTVELKDGYLLSYIIQTGQDNRQFNGFASENADEILTKIDELIVDEVDSISAEENFWFKKISNKAGEILAEMFKKDTGEDVEFTFFAVQRDNSKNFMPFKDGMPSLED